MSDARCRHHWLRGAMGNARLRERRKARFLRENPICCFCGGKAVATTWDHVPPRACFPNGHFPEEFEFPACMSCNQGTRRHDQIFGLYVHLAASDEENYDDPTVLRLARGVANNDRDALPRLNLTANQKRASLRQLGARRMPGEALRDVPLIHIPPAFNDAAISIARKLACALYYRESHGRILSHGHRIAVGWNQLQNPRFAPMVRFFIERLPDQTIGMRPNLAQPGRRFGYKSGLNEIEDFFIYAAQFGAGMVLWGIVTPPGKTTSEPLRSIEHTVFGPTSEP